MISKSFAAGFPDVAISRKTALASWYVSRSCAAVSELKVSAVILSFCHCSPILARQMMVRLENKCKDSQNPYFALIVTASTIR